MSDPIPPAPATHPNPNLYPTPDRGGPKADRQKSACTTVGLIGCGAVLVVILIIGMVGMSWVRGFLADFEKNPELTTLRTMVRLNPDLDVAATDEAANTITIRHKASGEEFTLNIEEVARDGISITTSDGSFRFHIDPDEGRIEAGGADESITLGGRETRPPAWLAELVPDAWPSGQSMMLMRRGDRTEGLHVWRLEGADTDETAAALKAALEQQGFTVEQTTVGTGSQRIASLTATHADSDRRIEAQIIGTTAKEPLQVNLSYQGPEEAAPEPAP